MAFDKAQESQRNGPDQVKKTRIIRTEADRHSAAQAIQFLPLNKPLKVTVEVYKKNRSLAQNNLLWMWMTQLSNEYGLKAGKFYDPEVWKLQMCKQFLGMEHLEFQNGEEWEEIRVTSKLNTAEFTQFLEDIDHFVGSEYEVQLKHPDDLYHEAMGLK